MTHSSHTHPHSTELYHVSYSGLEEDLSTICAEQSEPLLSTNLATLEIPLSRTNNSHSTDGSEPSIQNPFQFVTDTNLGSVKDPKSSQPEIVLQPQPIQDWQSVATFQVEVQSRCSTTGKSEQRLRIQSLKTGATAISASLINPKLRQWLIAQVCAERTPPTLTIRHIAIAPLSQENGTNRTADIRAGQAFTAHLTVQWTGLVTPAAESLLLCQCHCRGRNLLTGESHWLYAGDLTLRRTDASGLPSPSQLTDRPRPMMQTYSASLTALSLPRSGIYRLYVDLCTQTDPSATAGYREDALRVRE